MRTLGGFAVIVSVAAAMLAGCDASQLPIRARGASPQSRTVATRASSTNYTVLHSFGAAPDANSPSAGLIGVGGTLYGTTAFGGSDTAGYCGYTPPYGCGAVFTITTRGAEKVLHTFEPQKRDGSLPDAALIYVGGTLYGTTSEGGSCDNCVNGSIFYGCGTVFSISTSGTEKVLHSFAAFSDGAGPNAALTNVNGTLYGTTFRGGGGVCASGFYQVGCGTVFSITTGGAEAILYKFGPGRHARWSRASLIEEGRRLYGTTVAGGAYRKYGTVFSITLGGKENVTHSFGNGTDGREPVAGLIQVNGTFYGTTREGGAYGDGTVFSVTPGGTEKVVYSFGGGSDGARPFAGLISVKGVLYGTTYNGGGSGCSFSGFEGCGTVFSVTTIGQEGVLHRFGVGSDGASPVAGLTEMNGTLYGTTWGGGTHGDGTVFALKP